MSEKKQRQPEVYRVIHDIFARYYSSGI